MCTNTLRSVLGVGLAQFLRDESIFLLPDNGSAIACLNGFQQQISSMGLQSNLVSLCFSDISEFVSSPHLCGGIQTKKDWMEKLGPTPLDSACRGDLSVSTSCHVCHNSRKAVLKRLLGRIKNVGAGTNLQCNSLDILYAVGVANEFGPKNRKTASCILSLPFLPKKPRAHFEMVLYSCVGTAIAVILLCSIGISYWRWARTKLGDKHRRFVRINRSILSNAVKPNMDRSDVYSFGVLLLEIMSGRKALDTSVACSSEYLITDWAWKLRKTNKVVEVVDCRMLESGEVSTMERFVLVGILCSHVTVAFRPSMAEALKMLEGEAIIPAIPDKPFPQVNHRTVADRKAFLSALDTDPSFDSTVVGSDLSFTQLFVCLHTSTPAFTRLSFNKATARTTLASVLSPLGSDSMITSSFYGFKPSSLAVAEYPHIISQRSAGFVNAEIFSFQGDSFYFFLHRLQVLLAPSSS
ncbi:hypothetical protein SUGI_0476660 [Cryptomeria japonica]|nr:hypothetical protein SUGI_0476660 [Cryptomeria japonica]